MRADRLVSLVLLLQRRGRVTAADLAAELEVSVATARRDLEALSAAGVPVYPQPGRGGGWQLVGGARTDLSGLSAGESEALFLLLAPALAGADRVAPEARTAVRKLVQALPETFRDDAEAASRAVVVDPLRWGAEERPVRDVLALLQRAVVRRRVVDFGYTARNGTVGRRRVEPYGVVDKDGTWYLLAGAQPTTRPTTRPTTQHSIRTYRVDRIEAAEILAESFEPPADLDLDAQWTRTRDAVDAARSSVWATIEVDRDVAPIVRAQFGRYVRESDPGHRAAEGRSALQVGAHLPVALAEQLAGWGAHVRVLDPPEVRDHLARIGAELVAAYGSVGAADERQRRPQ